MSDKRWLTMVASGIENGVAIFVETAYLSLDDVKDYENKYGLKIHYIIEGKHRNLMYDLLLKDKNELEES